MAYQGSFLRGDFAALREALVKIKKLTVAIPKITAACAPELRDEVQRQFSAGTNPYQTAWVPLRPRTLAKHGPPPLTHTGSMRAGITVQGTNNSIVFKAPHPAFLHQYGWGAKKPPRKRKGRGRPGKIQATRQGGSWGPKRQIFPDGRVPNVWRRMIRRIARDVMGVRRGGY
jgi:hypothetical protein